MSYPIYLKPSHSRPNARRETRTPCFAKPEHASHQQLIILNDRRIAMAWVCNCCPNSSCWNCANIFDDLADAIEHIRKYHGINIGRPGAVGCSDSHGHQWFCFDCETAFKDHRSFNSDRAMLQHLTDCHDDYIIHANKAGMDTDHLSYCPSCG